MSLNTDKDSLTFTTSNNTTYDLIGGGLVAGSNTQIIYNNGGSYAGDADLTFGNGSKIMTAAGGYNTGSTGRLETQSVKMLKTVPGVTTDKLYADPSNDLYYNGNKLALASTSASSGTSGKIQLSNGSNGFTSDADLRYETDTLYSVDQVNSGHTQVNTINVNNSTTQALLFANEGHINNPVALLFSGNVPATQSNRLYRQDTNLVFNNGTVSNNVIVGDGNALFQDKRIPYYDNANSRYTANSSLTATSNGVKVQEVELQTYAPGSGTNRIFTDGFGRLFFDGSTVRHHVRSYTCLSMVFKSLFETTNNVAYALPSYENLSDSVIGGFIVPFDCYVVRWSIIYVSNTSAVTVTGADNCVFQLCKVTGRPASEGTIVPFGSVATIAALDNGTWPVKSVNESTALSQDEIITVRATETGALTPTTASSVYVQIWLSNQA